MTLKRTQKFIKIFPFFLLSQGFAREIPKEKRISTLIAAKKKNKKRNYKIRIKFNDDQPKTHSMKF